MKRLILTLSLALALTMTASAKTLVAYFSFPIDSGKEALDATSGASVTIKDGRHYGNAQFIAMIVADTLGESADLFEIDTGGHYPHDYKQIFNATQSEQRKNVKPKLLKRVQNMAQYDKIVIVCPVWWYKMPLAVQSFLDEYDLSGKTIYLSVTHGGSRSAGIEREIAAAEPKATVSKNMLILSRSDTAKSEQKIKDWAKGL
ncbi:MAG: flavodoxin [Treponema sp.]|uniref:flavodoxin n=1 Tax=Treponema sp. TaxID=166 RepID=UPI0025CCDF77|nr:flavodoxin [Treponema sp.]MBQ9280694.1 flavodoxin [Treponema sp.]